jgi:hypothetical protein
MWVMSNPGETWSHRLKLQRARQHIQTLNVQVHGFGDRHPYEFFEEFNPESGEHFARVKVLREPLPMWSLLVGDALQTMRASLEHLAFSLVLAHHGEPDKPEDISFPITDKPGKFEAVRKQRIELVHPKAQAVIQGLQPYHRGDDAANDYLMVLDDLARVDRHRSLHVTPAFVVNTAADIVFARDLYITEAVLHLGAVEDGAKIATFRYTVTGPNPEMHVEISPEFGIAFDEGWPGRGRPVVEALGTIRRYVAEVVFPPLERFL